MKTKFFKLFLLTLLISSGSAFSQKCEITKDPFSNQHTVVSNYGDKVVYFENKGGKFKMEMVFTYSGAMEPTVAKGAEVLYKLEDGQMIKLITVVDAVPKRVVVANQFGGQVTTNYSYVFDITLEDLKKFAASKVSVVRYPDTKGGTSDFEAKNGKPLIKALSKGASCIVENL